MTKWIIPANSKKYDHASSFATNGFIEWRQMFNYEIGDIVYIYCALPYAKVMYKTVVEAVDISKRNRISNDDMFWRNPEEIKNNAKYKFVRLKLIEQADREELSLDSLKLNGLKQAPQKGFKVNDQLADYIDNYLHDDYSEGVYPESAVPKDSYEGALKKATVNRYERSSVARRKCIEYRGIKCAVCGMSFEERYGEIGKGFIHVHHIVPLNKIGSEYAVDYEKDLIPVCPNCHAMLHRKMNGRYPTVEELKKMINE